MTRRRRYEVALTLLLILLLAGALRFYDLGGEPLWYDETYAVAFAHRSVSDILTVVPRRGVSGHPDEFNPPLYFLLLHGWVRLVGDSAVAVRVPSAIFGIAAAAFLFLVGLELRGAALGLVAAFLSAASYFLIRYAQEGRAYSLLVLLGAASYYFFIRMLRRGKTGGAAVGYAASTALLLYTHYHAAFLVLAQLCTVACLWRRLAKVRLRWLAALAAAALAFGPWLPTLWGQIQALASKRDWWVPKPDFQSLELLNQLWVSAPHGYLNIGPIAIPPYTVMVLFWAMVFIGGFVWARAPNHTSGTHWFRPAGWAPAEETVLLALWLLVPILAPYTLSRIGPFSIFWPRYMIGAVPAFYLLVARGVVAPNRRWLAGGLCAVVLVLTMPRLLTYYRLPQKEQWDRVASLLERKGTPGDLVVLSNSRIPIPFEYYYRGSLDRYIMDEENDRAEAVKRLKEATIGYRRIWLIISHTHHPPMRAVNILLRLRTPGSSIHDKQFIGVWVWLFKFPDHPR